MADDYNNDNINNGEEFDENTIIDEETEEAVKKFQRKNGLAADGVAGDRTLVLLFGY